jgi:hypothetical protein
MNDTSRQAFEFRFYALHPALQSPLGLEIDASAIDSTDERELDLLATRGWRMAGITVNPKYPDQLLVALQRERDMEKNFD